MLVTIDITLPCKEHTYEQKKQKVKKEIDLVMQHKLISDLRVLAVSRAVVPNADQTGITTLTSKLVTVFPPARTVITIFEAITLAAASRAAVSYTHLTLPTTPYV